MLKIFLLSCLVNIALILFIQNNNKKEKFSNNKKKMYLSFLLVILATFIIFYGYTNFYNTKLDIMETTDTNIHDIFISKI